jgi:hypothetical protein
MHKFVTLVRDHVLYCARILLLSILFQFFTLSEIITLCSLNIVLSNLIVGSIICVVSCSPSDMFCLMMPKLEAGQVKLQSRLEEEEEAKAALMGRIQRLTKLILVSTKNTLPSSIPERPNNRRRHSFGEDEVCNFANLFV